MALTEYQENSVQIVYSGNAGSPGQPAGGWANDTTVITGMIANGFSGGAAYKTTTNGDTAVFTVPTGTKAVYLTTATISAAYTAAEATHETAGPGGRFQVAVDGVDQGVIFTAMNGTPSTSGIQAVFYSVMQPLVRNLDGGAGHTVTITASTNSTAPVILDSIWTVPTGFPPVTPGQLVSLGDSWTYGSGSAYIAVAPPNGGLFGSFAFRLSTLLQTKLSRPVPFSQRGSVGDRLHGNDRASSGVAPGNTGTTRAGAMWRFLSEVVPLSPEFITVQYGVNDFLLSFASVGDWIRHLHTLLCEIEDCLDVYGTNGTPVKVSIGTPGYTTGAAVQANFLPGNYGHPFDNYEEAVQATHREVALFPWARIARVYEAMDGRNSLVTPNSSGANQGNHPNDLGHSIIAQAHLAALLGGGS